MKTRYKITAQTYDSKNRLISTAQNSYSKTHPIQKHFAKLANQPERIYLHAEILAILRAGDKKISSIVITNHSSSTLPRPCPVCMKAIESYGIGKVVLRTLEGKE